MKYIRYFLTLFAMGLFWLSMLPFITLIQNHEFHSEIAQFCTLVQLIILVILLDNLSKIGMEKFNQGQKRPIFLSTDFPTMQYQSGPICISDINSAKEGCVHFLFNFPLCWVLPLFRWNRPKIIFRTWPPIFKSMITSLHTIESTEKQGGGATLEMTLQITFLG